MCVCVCVCVSVCVVQVMRAFAKPNLTETTQERFEALFRVMAGLFELFLFVYIGLTLFIEDEVYNIWSYTVSVCVCVCVCVYACMCVCVYCLCAVHDH